MIIMEKLDITTVKRGYIAHGVNCQGVMGAGIAKAISDKWPKVKEAYSFLDKRNMKLCKVQPVVIEPDLIIFNCFTQFNYGRNPIIRYANESAIRICLDKVLKMLPKDMILYVPKIGCGLGGLDWEKDVKHIFNEVARNHPDAIIHIVEL